MDTIYNHLTQIPIDTTYNFLTQHPILEIIPLAMLLNTRFSALVSRNYPALRVVVLLYVYFYICLNGPRSLYDCEVIGGWDRRTWESHCALLNYRNYCPGHQPGVLGYDAMG